MTRKNRVLILTEGRNAWNITKKKKARKAILDSPPLNLIHASMIAKKELDRGNQVILLPIVDKLVSTKEYTYPRTFPFIMGYLPKNPTKEDLKRFFREDAKTSFRRWKDHLNIHILPTKRARDIINRSNTISRVAKFDALSESEEIFWGFKEYRLHYHDDQYKRLVANMNKLAPIPMSAFDIETGRFLIDLVLKMLKLKNKQNLDISYEVFPSMYVNTKENILHIFEPIFRYYNRNEAMKKVNAMFSDLLAEKNIIPTYGIPLFCDINGFYSSATRIYLDKSNVIIEPRSRELGRFGEKYKISQEAFMETIFNKDLVSIKYPIVILDYVIRLFEKLTMRASLENSEEIHNLIKNVIKDEIDLAQYIENLAYNTKIKGKIDKVYFVEGDMGGINTGTGGLVDKIFEIVANSIDASYIRITSLEREFFEENLKRIGFLPLIEMIFKLENDKGSIYVEKDGKFIRSKIDDIVQ